MLQQFSQPGPPANGCAVSDNLLTERPRRPDGHWALSLIAALCLAAFDTTGLRAKASKPTVRFDRVPVDTTFDEPPRALSTVSAQLPKPWPANDSERLVYVQITVDSTGAVTRASTVLPIAAALDSVIVRAARQWTFVPARKRGIPVATAWWINVELLHPKSRELSRPEDTLSVARGSAPGNRDAEVRVRGSAYFDSVARKYRYSYDIENRSRGGERITGFAMLGCAVEAVDGNTTRMELDYSEYPPYWNGFAGCGGRRDVFGLIPWEPDSAGLFSRTIRPGGRLTPVRFLSRFPPGTVRWVVQTAAQDTFTYLMTPCSSSDSGPLEALPLSGTIVGPIDPALRKQEEGLRMPAVRVR